MKNNRTLRLIKAPDKPQGDYQFFLTEDGVSENESPAAKKKKEKMDAIQEDTQALIKKDLLID